jgi:hypothetical protein
LAEGQVEKLTNVAAGHQASMLRANADMLISRDCSRVYNAKLQDLKRRVAEADRQRDMWHERASAAEAKAQDLNLRMKEDGERRAGTWNTPQSDQVDSFQSSEINPPGSNLLEADPPHPNPETNPPQAIRAQSRTSLSACLPLRPTTRSSRSGRPALIVGFWN